MRPNTTPMWPAARIITLGVILTIASCSPAALPPDRPTPPASDGVPTASPQLEQQQPTSVDGLVWQDAPSGQPGGSATGRTSGPRIETDGLSIPLSSLTGRREALLHDYPDVFLQQLEPDTADAADPSFDRTGYRVQLLSTRDVGLADSLRSRFIVWSDTTFNSYRPEAYLHFRQPYYRLHVGDFTQRTDAIRLARYLKRRYPDAWVVHDRILPERVPADTLQVIPVPGQPPAPRASNPDLRR